MQERFITSLSTEWGTRSHEDAYHVFQRNVEKAHFNQTMTNYSKINNHTYKIVRSFLQMLMVLTTHYFPLSDISSWVFSCIRYLRKLLFVSLNISINVKIYNFWPPLFHFLGHHVTTVFFFVDINRTFYRLNISYIILRATMMHNTLTKTFVS